MLQRSLSGRLTPALARQAAKFQRRFLATAGELVQEKTGSNEASSAVAKKKRKLWPRLVFGSAVIVGAGYGIDLWVNDDWEMLSDPWRQKLSPSERQNRPKVVILGSGWASLSLLRKLHTDKFNVTVVSPRNYFLFTPLLPSTTSGTVEVRSIMEPIRKYCKRSDAEEAEFLELEATKIDTVKQTVHCVDSSSIKGVVSEVDIPYDYLVVAVGAETATFGIPGVQENSVYMKSVEDSAKIRNRIMDCFETAVIPGQPEEEIKRLLNFVVVGGGPSGVEYTAELHDFVERDVKKAFPSVANKVKITLVEALPHILNMFDARLIDYVEKRFATTPGMNLMLKSQVVAVEPKKLRVKQDGQVQDVPFGTLVWVTGNAPKKLVSDLLAGLGTASQPVRRAISVDEHLLVQGTKNVFSIGDCAVDKKNDPQTAQVASQQGRYLGRLFNKYAEDLNSNRSAVPFTTASPFQYHHVAKFAYVGDWKAVGEFQGASQTKGFWTFLVWRSVYLSKLLSLRNRVLVSFDWAKAFVFGRDISRG